MSCKSLIGRLFLTAMVVGAIGAGSAAAQCCGGGAVGYSPTYTTAYAPSAVVYQSYRPTTGWYPGALLDRWRINRWTRRNDATVVTAGYAPTYATAYTAAYAPTYPPNYYATSYRAAYPITYSAGYASTVAYSPASSCATCCTDGCSRAVVMRPVCDTCVSPCSGCATGCSSCGGSSYVGQAVYESSGCAGCASGGTSPYLSTPSTQSPTPAGANESTPQPGLDPKAPVAEERTSLRPEEDSVVNPPEEQPNPAEDPDATPPSTMFQPPQLFNPGDRVTQRPSTPVWTAVYHTTAKPSQRVSRPVSSPSSTKPTAEEVARAAQGWTSAGK